MNQNSDKKHDKMASLGVLPIKAVFSMQKEKSTGIVGKIALITPLELTATTKGKKNAS